MNSKNWAAAAEEDEMVEVDGSNEEMARRYVTLVGTIGKKKFAKKRDWANYKEDENVNLEGSSARTKQSKSPCQLLPLVQRLVSKMKFSI